jgi:hypothetical protein
MVAVAKRPMTSSTSSAFYENEFDRHLEDASIWGKVERLATGSSTTGTLQMQVTPSRIK